MTKEDFSPLLRAFMRASGMYPASISLQGLNRPRYISEWERIRNGRIFCSTSVSLPQTHNCEVCSVDDDANIVMLAKDGHVEAVASLYEKYFDAIYRFFYWQTNKKSEIAEDLTQDTFVEMAKSIHRFRGDSSFKNWLYAIAKRQLNKWLKSKYDLPQESLFNNLSCHEEIIDPEHQQQVMEKVNKLLVQLSEREVYHCFSVPKKLFSQRNGTETQYII